MAKTHQGTKQKGQRDRHKSKMGGLQGSIRLTENRERTELLINCNYI